MIFFRWTDADLAEFPRSSHLIRPLRLKFGYSGLPRPNHVDDAFIWSQLSAYVSVDALLCGADPNELREPRWAVAE